MDIQAKLTGFAMLGATWVMWVLVGLSIGGVAIALDRAIYLIRTSDNYRRLKRDLLAFLRVGDVDAARDRLAASKSVEAQVAAAGLANPEDGAASAEERIAGADAGGEDPDGAAPRVPRHAGRQRAVHRPARHRHRDHPRVRRAERIRGQGHGRA